MKDTIFFQDKRGRTWELFIDPCYWEMTCVRLMDDRDFNSPTSFHFMTLKEAEQFKKITGGGALKDVIEHYERMYNRNKFAEQER